MWGIVEVQLVVGCIACDNRLHGEIIRVYTCHVLEQVVGVAPTPSCWKQGALHCATPAYQLMTMYSSGHHSMT